MSEEKQANKPKDLTGIFELPQADPPPSTDSSDPFAVNELPPAEQVDSFESIDQLGMMDHPSTEESTAPGVSSEPTIAEDPFQTTPASEEATFQNENADWAAPVQNDAPPATFEASPEIAPDPFASVTATPAGDPLEDIKEYSEMTRGPIEGVPVHHPFHLMISGSFGPFERDKLLLFITENPIGIASSDLDLQLKAGRVLLPRISEYAGVRLVQELRDSGLQFSLKPSSRDHDEPSEHSKPIEFHFDGHGPRDSASISIPILESSSPALAQYEEIDVVHGHQFIKAEMVEVERSDLFQEIIDRMTEGLKQKARLKGGQALTRLDQKIVPLRLPSQYQISVKATVLRSKS